MNMANVLTPFVLFPVQSASSFGHNARIAPSLTGTLSSKIEQNLTRLIFRTTLDIVVWFHHTALVMCMSFGVHIHAFNGRTHFLPSKTEQHLTRLFFRTTLNGYPNLHYSYSLLLRWLTGSTSVRCSPATKRQKNSGYLGYL